MKKLTLVISILLVNNLFLYSQTVTGKLLDDKGAGLPGCSVLLYANSKIYTTTSGSNGIFTFDNITEVKEKQIPSNYNISNSYPNPFNPRTRIDFNFPKASRVKIDIFDITGQKVKELTERELNAGSTHIDLELNGLANGVYFARITIDDQYSVARKLMLLYGTQHLITSNSGTALSLEKSLYDIKLDSLLVIGITIQSQVFKNLPSLTGSFLDLGNFVVFPNQLQFTDNSKLPEQSDNFVASSLQPNSMTLSFNSPSTVPIYNVGDIIAGTSNGGYLRKVNSIIQNGSDLIINTTTASLDEFIKQGTIDTSLSLGFPSSFEMSSILQQHSIYNNSSLIKYSSDQAVVSKVNSANVFQISIPNYKMSLTDNINGGELSIVIDTIVFSFQANLTDCKLRYDSGLKEFKVMHELNINGRFVNTVLSISGKISKTDSLPLIPPIILPPLPVPGILIRPEFNLLAGLKGTFTMSAGVKTANTLAFNVKVVTGGELVGNQIVPTGTVTTIGSGKLNLEPTASLSGEVQLFVKPSLDFRVYEVLGLGVFVKGFGYTNLLYPPFIYEIGLGVSGGLSFNLKAFSINLYQYDWTLIEKRWPFDTNRGSGTPCPSIPTVSYSGKTYNTVQIGNQCWLKENLDVGTRINGSLEQNNNSIIEKYCLYDDPLNCNIYGGLYQWNEAMQYVNTEGARGICPVGWHIPTDAEFQTLGTEVNNDGNKLKREETNESGFSALISGGGFELSVSGGTGFWSSSDNGTSSAGGLGLNGGRDSVIYFYHGPKGYGFSVRCLKD
jgi:uncharacterized protein (TIGR02145 family)